MPDPIVGHLGPAQPLDPGARAYFEHRFGCDFGEVRVHSGPAAALGARQIEARAFTVGRDVVFGAGEYSPSTPDGRRLLAHELTHVVQQSGTAAPRIGSTAARRPTDAELHAGASSAPRGARSGGPIPVSGHAPRGQPQFERRTIGNREFEVGDVRVEGTARRDISRLGVLLPGPDQAHIVVTRDARLGYEVAHTQADDPFRWDQLRRIVDAGALTIRGVGLTESFRVKEVLRGQESVVTRSLAVLGLAGGITLPRLSLQRTINANAPVVVASADDARDTIFYDSGGGGGHGALGSNSLAHELFGHLVLARRGIPFQHGQQLTTAHGARDPFGRVFVGSVNDFIDRFAGARNAPLQSPTQNVGTGHVLEAMNFIMRNGAAELDVSRPGGGATDAFGLRWEILSRNYEMLRLGPTPPARPTADSPEGILQWVVGWAAGLTATQDGAFRGFLRAVVLQGGFRGSHSTRLASDALARLPAATP